MASEKDRVIAEDLALPVVVEPGVDSSTPEDLDWSLSGTSQPNAATFHINHTDVTQVKVGMLRPSDMPEGSQFVLTKEIPIILIDSLDKFWAGESKSALPLNGLRVPIEGDTEEEAKQNLAGDLAAQFPPADAPVNDPAGRCGPAPDGEPPPLSQHHGAGEDGIGLDRSQDR